jgi:cytohesin
VNRQDNEGKTALHTAARKGYKDCVTILLERGALIDAKDDVGWTPLHEATSEGSIDFHPPPHTSTDTLTPVRRVSAGNIEVAEMLLRHGAGVEVGDKEGCTPMHLASRCGDSDSLQLLIEGPPDHLDHDHDLDHSHDDQPSDAAGLGRAWRRPDVNIRDASGWTPIHEAANEGNTQCIQLLLDYGACRVGCRVRVVCACACAAVCRVVCRVVGLMRSGAGADVNSPDADGNTPLHKAADNGALPSCILLVEHGARIDVKNHLNFTPYQLATIRCVCVVCVCACVVCVSCVVRVSCVADEWRRQ